MMQFVLLAALFFSALSSDAQACVFLPGPVPSKGQLRFWSLQKTNELRRHTQQRFASGPVEFAKELAEILVPNIRPIRLSRSTCGPAGEVDLAGGFDSFSGDLLDDVRLKGIDLDEYPRQFRVSDDGIILGQSCNSEFRHRFADFLRTRLKEEELQVAWLFLVPRTRQGNSMISSYHRLVSFDQNTRRPPIRWTGEDEWIKKDIARFNKRNLVGRRLGEAMSAFWTQQEPMLALDDLVCPKAAAIWRKHREQLVGAILSERDARVLRRKQRQAAPTG